MKLNAPCCSVNLGFVRPLNFFSESRRCCTPNNCHIESSVCCCREKSRQAPSVSCRSRRDVLVTSFLSIGYCFLHPTGARAGEDKVSDTILALPAAKNEEDEAESVASRIYDATVIGEPRAVGKNKEKVWEKVMNARIVYLGEAEQVPTSDDRELELQILIALKKRCLEAERQISLALEALPSDLQEQLNQYMDRRIDGPTLKSYASHWSPQLWQEYEPLLSYSRDNGIQLLACGTPLKVLRTVQAEGIHGLSKDDRQIYVPPTGTGFISGYTSISQRHSIDLNSPNHPIPFEPSSYLYAQARVVENYTMSQIILKAVADGGPTAMLVVVTGASHVIYGSRGTGLPARISKKMQKKNQVVVLLDPERQCIRREGEVPIADLLWYSAARPCSRNCFDRAEIARVMNAASKNRDSLPQDIQNGLDLGLVSPEVLQNFLDLERYPLISELMHRFQGFRERLLADPKFLHRLAIEEAISITTSLLAQFERRRENFLKELDYVITDTVRGIIVDFFTVWLPAPTLSFRSLAADEVNTPYAMDSLKGIFESIPDNAFQKDLPGKEWNLSNRAVSVLFGGMKLAGVGFVSSVGAAASSSSLHLVRGYFNPVAVTGQRNKQSPILKSALVYACFLGTSANLRYQIIAGIVEHRIADQFSSQTLLVNMLSFIA